MINSANQTWLEQIILWQQSSDDYNNHDPKNKSNKQEKNAQRLLRLTTWIKDIWKFPILLHFNAREKLSNPTLPYTLLPDASTTPEALTICKELYD